MILYLSIFTLILTLFITFHNYKSNKNSLFLAAYLIAMCLYGMLHYFLFEGNSVMGIALLFSHVSPFFYLPGAMLYLYTRNTLNNEFKFTKQDLWHVLPFIIGLLNVLPYYFVSFEQKIAFAEKLTANPLLNQLISNNLLFPYYVSTIIRGGLFIGYIFFSAWLLYKSWKTNNKQHQFQSKKNTLKWLTFLVANAFIMSASFIVLTFVFYVNAIVIKSNLKSYHFNFIAELSFALIPLVMIFFPRVVYGSTLTVASTKAPSAAQETKTTKKNEKMKVLKERIMTYFEKDKPYLNPNFSFEDLLLYLNVPKSQLYTCLNSYMDQKFTQLRTHFRIEHAKKLLLAEELDSASLQKIWKESGFSSKTNFFTTFKEETGLTPTEFVQQNLGIKNSMSKD